MDKARWQAIEDVFLQATELQGEARQRLLREIHDKDPDLCREVNELLAADTDVGGRVADAIGATLKHAASSPLQDLRIERYELLSELGRGGMGTVFLARRDDRQYDMQVAVKVTRHGMLGNDIGHRMRQERHILAGLDHPNICKLLDGGTTDDGMPYFVMEYIEGEPIDTFCERRELSIDDRLRLFHDVCNAVHYAHQKLVIHRDLKPSNILVTEDGNPKLLDFGIAKILDPDASEDAVSVTTPLVTRSGMRLMTPTYASPEQVRGEALSTATDIYSLGVLLYRLLTGREPYHLHKQSAREIERIICEQEPTRPSLVVAESTDDARGRQHAKKLAGDLDNIVSVALRKEPEERYASADQLAEDIRRHLEGRLVAARPHTLLYRASKFIRRYRWGVAAVMLIILSLSGGLGVALWQARVAATERLEAQLQRVRAEEAQRLAEHQQRRSANLAELMIDVFQVSDPSEARGNSVTVREILDTSVERIRTDLPLDSLDRADLVDSIGRVYQGLGLYKSAEVLLEEALAARQAGPASDLDIAASQNHLAELRLAQDRAAESAELIRDSLELRRREVGEDHPLVIESLINLGAAAAGQRQMAEAEGALAQALEIQDRLLPPDHPDFIETVNNLAGLRWFQKNLESAETLYRRAVRLARQHHGADHPQTVGALANLTTVLHSLGKFQEALPLAEETVRLRRHLLEPGHPSLAKSLNTQSVLFFELGDLDRAEPLQLEAVTIKRQQLGPSHGSTLSSLRNLANLYAAQGRYDEAIPTYRGVLESRRGSLTPDHPILLRDLGEFGDMLLLSGDFSGAESIFREALEATPEDLSDHALQSTLLTGLGSALFYGGRFEEALPYLQRSLGYLQDIEDLPVWREVRVRGALMTCQLALGDPIRAREVWSVLETRIDTLPRNTPHEDLASRHLDLLLSSVERPKWLPR